MRLDDFLARLGGVTGGNGQWHARCPAHEDRQASLSVALGDEGKILLRCWAGCSLDAITHAAGVNVADLFDTEARQRESLGLGVTLANALKPKLPTEEEIQADVGRLSSSPDLLGDIRRLKGWTAPTLAALDIGWRGNRLTIPVRDPEGRIVQWLRYWPASQPKIIATKGHPRIPYYAIARTDGDLWIVEGETDAITMAHAGLDVIGAPGAAMKPYAAWLASVRGRRVIVCFDHDEPGRWAAARWAMTAADCGAAEVRTLELDGPDGYDVSDLLVDLHGDVSVLRAALLELAETAEPYQALRVAPAPTPAPKVNGVEPGEIVVTPLSSYRVRRLRMLWRERIPVGRLGIIFGPPGQGKSTLLALLVADVTRAGGRVLIASAEDAPATTLLPRMIAAGADIRLVDLIETKAAAGTTSLVLPRDLKAVEGRMHGHALAIIDPFSAHLGDEINAWHEQQVRAQVLAPLGHYADTTGCAVPLVMHMNKSNGMDALARISGTGGFGAAARFALLLGTHPDDVGLDPGERRLALVHVKASESARQPAMIFRRRLVPVDSEDGPAVVPMLDLIDDTAQIAPEAVLEHTDPDEAGAFSEAIDFLRYELADGPKLAKRLLATSRERGDFSERTLRKAKRALKVSSVRDQEGWRWERRP